MKTMHSFSLILISVMAVFSLFVVSPVVSPSRAESSAPALAQAADSPSFSPIWDSTETGHAQAIAWGDMNGDGHLDLAVGNSIPGYQGEQIRLYRNDGLDAHGKLQTSLSWSSVEVYMTTSLAWGDIDGDGDLDLAVGTDSQMLLFRNDGSDAHGGPQMTLVWSSTDGSVRTVAWGDMDQDGDLDLVVEGSPNRIYRNDSPDGQGRPLLTSYILFNGGGPASGEGVLGDMDGDGDLDLATGDGNPQASSVCLYRNDGLNAEGFPQMVLNSCLPLTNWCYMSNLAWGDINGDGKLDLAVGYEFSHAWRPIFALFINLGMDEQGITQMAEAWLPQTEDGLSDSRVAWGDVDGDRDLDLVVGDQDIPNMVYRNDGGTLTPNPEWTANQVDRTLSLALADVDGDGNLDIAFGNNGFPVRIYHNDTFTLLPNDPQEVDSGRGGFAWGDIDGDGDLDVATRDGIARNDGLNASGGLQMTMIWNVPGESCSSPSSVAWGDVDRDGDLDLALGCSDRTQIYRNDGPDPQGNQQMTLFWSSAEPNPGISIAFGDMDGDGNLDLIVGNNGQVNRLYHNDRPGPGGNLSMTMTWSSAEIAQTTSIALGDVDNDGDLDLAVGNYDQPNRLYRNDGTDALGNQHMTLIWSAKAADQTNSIAWGDIDNDGKLDLAVGNFWMADQLYRNDSGSLSMDPAWSSIEFDRTNSIALGDVDGDGDLDLVTSNWGGSPGNPTEPIRVYRNDGGVLTTDSVWSSKYYELMAFETKVAWEDIDGDGDLDVIMSSRNGIHIFFNTRDKYALPEANPLIKVDHPGPKADFYSTPAILDTPVIPITYTLKDAQSKAVKKILASYSLDGGGKWLPAAPTSDTVMTNLPTSPGGMQYTFNWDVYTSGFFGQSDNVVFRIQAVPSITNLPGGTPGPYQYGSYASSTFPFRVRGIQVRVMNGADPAPGAIVYRLPAGSAGQAGLITDLAQTPYVTDTQGYLQGRGEILPGDRLAALLPVSLTPSSTLYYTSAAPNPTGLDLFTVASGGVQTLTVSSSHPLVLFNLKVSLEWDARQDTRFLEQLHFDLDRASELLFQWSSGQVALGQVTIFHDRQHWADADVRIYATNRRRPAATLGGITTVDLPDPNTPELVYEPGMVHIGKVWNRYGDPSSSTGEDWPRALAHELGHYALFQDDDYLGLDAAGHLISVNTCIPTPMADPYRDDYSAFKSSTNWLTNCQDTLANKTTGRSDWASIYAFYPALQKASILYNPSFLPLAVTQVSEVAPGTPPQALPDPRFYLKDKDGVSIQPGSSARAFLFRPDRLVDLGSPTVDSILAPGAQADDRLCVFQLSASLIGCKTVTPGDDQQLTLNFDASWKPEVIISPQNAHTIQVSLKVPDPGPAFFARLYSGDGTVANDIPLTLSGSTYSGVFSLTQPATDGNILIWQANDNQHVVVADFAMEGNPTRVRSGFTRVRSGFAPAMSSDGQVVLYTNSLTFPQNEFYTLQAATFLPAAPAWATQVGHGYWLSKSSGAPDLAGASLSMGYLPYDIPPGEEAWLKVYRWDPASSSWLPLPTQINTTENSATAIIAGPGLYTLMSTIELPLTGLGWDLFAYPVQATRSVAQALESIAGLYNTVYHFNASLPKDPWQVYAPDAPAWVNDLSTLSFGQVYWINLSQAVTLKLKGGSARSVLAGGPATPPATYYGEVLPSSGFIPIPGMSITASIDGVDCGSSQTRLIDGEIVYSIHISAEGPASPGCGQPGKTVHFRAGNTILIPQTLWSSDQVMHLNIGKARQTFFPFIRR